MRWVMLALGAGIGVTVWLAWSAAEAQVMPGGCFASLDPNGNNILDTMVNGYICSIESWTTTVATTGRSILRYLIIIEIFAALWMLWQGGLNDLMAALFRSVFFIGLTYLLLLNGLGTDGWVATSLRYFTDTGNTLLGIAGGSSLSASNMIEQALDIVSKMWGAAEDLGLASLIVVGFSIIVMMISFAIAIGAYVMAALKLVVIVVMGGLFIPFGAWGATRDLMVSYIKASMGAALEMLSVQLLVSIAITFVGSWVTLIDNIEAARPGWLTGLFVSETTPSLSMFLLLAACAIVFAVLVKELPGWLGAIPMGATTGRGGAALSDMVTSSAAMTARGVSAVASGVAAAVTGPAAAGSVMSAASSIYRQARAAGQSVTGAAGTAGGSLIRRPRTSYKIETMQRYANEKLGGAGDVGAMSGAGSSRSSAERNQTSD